MPHPERSLVVERCAPRGGRGPAAGVGGEVGGGLPVERAEEGIRRIARIVSSLKTFSGGDHDRSAIGECDPSAVARDALRLASVRLTGAVPVRVAASAPLPLVRAEPPRPTQVVVNLLINAIDAIEGQRGAGRGEIVLRCEAKAAWVELSVRLRAA